MQLNGTETTRATCMLFPQALESAPCIFASINKPSPLPCVFQEEYSSPEYSPDHEQGGAVPGAPIIAQPPPYNSTEGGASVVTEQPGGESRHNPNNPFTMDKPYQAGS